MTQIEEELPVSIFSGDEFVLDLIERYDIQNDDDGGYRLLQEATKHGHKAAVKLLVEKGARTNCDKYSGSYTPLHWAVMSGDCEMVEMLLDNGAKMFDDTWEGLSPFYLAVSGGEEVTVTYLYPSDQRESDRTIRKGEQLKMMDLSGIVSLLLSRGSAINQKCWEGQTPLHIACQSKSLLRDKTITILLEQGAIVNAWDNFGHTPLHVVAMSDVPDPCSLIALLLDYGANINAKTCVGATPLHVSSCRSRSAHGAEVVETLVRAGGHVNAKSLRGYTPLHMSLSRYQVDISIALINCGADLNSANNDNVTPLHYILRNNNKPILRHVARRGLDNIPSSLHAHRGFTYFSSCKHEIQLMKSMTIESSTVTFFDILISSDNKLASFASNEKIRRTAESGFNSFPIFTLDLQKQWARGLTRAAALNKLKEVYICFDNVVLMYDCLFRVAEFLSTDDIENWVESLQT